MKQVYYHFELWEDYQNGMYLSPKSISDEKRLINLARFLLTNDKLFLQTCLNVIANWKISSLVNLTNKSTNREAWLGQASCNYKYKVPEVCTRLAWKTLTIQDQFKANKIAKKVIKKFEKEYEKKDISLYLTLGK